MRRRSILTAGLLAGALIAGTAACGSDDDKTNTPAAEPEGTVTWWDTSDATNEAPVFKELIAKFEAANPKIKINYVNVPFSEARDKFKTAAQSGAGAPDVMRAEVAWTPEFASLGYLQPLDGTPALDKAEDYLAGPVGSTKYNGKTYAIPQVTDTLAVLYNKKLLADAGVANAPTTMAELKDAGLKLKAKKVDGVYLNPGGYFLLPFIYGEGGDLLNVDSKKITVNSPEAVKGLQTVQDLISSGAAPKPALTDGYNNMQTAFKEGKVGMVINGPWSVADDLSGTAFKDKSNLGIAPIPAGSGGKSGSPVGGHNYAVYAGSKVIPAAEKFIAFMNSAESQAFLSGKLGLLPTRTSAYALPEAQASEIVTAFKPVLDKATTRPAIAEGGSLFTPLDTQYVNVLSGKASAQQGLDAVADEYKKVLQGWS
jgi:arabinogalactan oligomer / maltooligosaccharide transport system substrate-binding protein